MELKHIRRHPGYIEAMEKIRKYKPGFRFTVDFANIPEAKANGLRIVLRDACKLGLLESVAIGAGWDKDGKFNPFMDETYRRTEAK